MLSSFMKTFFYLELQKPLHVYDKINQWYITKMINFMSREVTHAKAKCPNSKQQKSCKETFTVHLYDTFKD